MYKVRTQGCTYIPTTYDSQRTNVPTRYLNGKEAPLHFIIVDYQYLVVSTVKV